MYRFGFPLAGLAAIVVCKLWAPADMLKAMAVTIAWGLFGAWYSWRLSVVSLDGDALLARGVRSIRVPLSHLTVLEFYPAGRGPAMCTLGLNPPVSGVEKVRFIPAKGIEKDLRARITAAHAARVTAP